LWYLTFLYVTCVNHGFYFDIQRVFGKTKKLAAFRQLTREINELNKTDPLPAEFDAILSQRAQFRELFSQAWLADIMSVFALELNIISVYLKGNTSVSENISGILVADTVAFPLPLRFLTRSVMPVQARSRPRSVRQ